MPGSPSGMASLLAAGLWVVSCASSAPAPPPVTAPGARVSQVPPVLAPGGSIGGRVVASGSREPLAGALVEASSDVLASPRVATTDADGRYEVGALPEGTYRLTISRDGFVTRSLGAGRESPDIELRDDSRQVSANVVLAREATLTGRILGEDGTTRAGTLVRALRPRVENGHLVLAIRGSATTDDHGRFRIGGLPGGAYYISAADPAAGRPPTYHPGIASPDDAVRVEVPAGGIVTDIEFRLRPARAASVSGRITTHDRRALTAGSVAMTAGIQARPPRSLGHDVTLGPDGTFRFRNVAPGDYVVRARGETDRAGTWLFGRFALGVTGADVSDLNIVLTPGAVVSGRIDFNGRAGRPPPGTLTHIRIRAVAIDGTAFGDALSEVPDSAGEFRFRGIMPGEHVFRPEGLPESWSLAAVFLGGREITDSPVFLESDQQLRNLRVVATDVSTLVTGRVIEVDRDDAASDAAVVVFAADPGLWQWYSRRVRLVRPDLEGAYRASGLPPGDYLAIATRDVDDGDPLDHDLLARLAGQARRLTLQAAGHIALDLRVTAADPGRDVDGGR